MILHRFCDWFVSTTLHRQQSEMRFLMYLCSVSDLPTIVFYFIQLIKWRSQALIINQTMAMDLRQRLKASKTNWTKQSLKSWYAFHLLIQIIRNMTLVWIESLVMQRLEGSHWYDTINLIYGYWISRFIGF